MNRSIDSLIKKSLKWKEFFGKENTDEIIIQKSFTLAKAFSSILYEDVEVLRKTVKELGFEIKNEQWWSVYYDFILFMIHISDRESFALLDAPQRTLFIKNLLINEIQILSTEIDKELTDQFKENYFQNFRLFQKEFSVYKRDTKEITQNLNYMFAKRIAKRLGGEESAMLISHIFPVIIAAEIFFNIPQIINEKFIN